MTLYIPKVLLRKSYCSSGIHYLCLLQWSKSISLSSPLRERYATISHKSWGGGKVYNTAGVLDPNYYCGYDQYRALTHSIVSPCTTFSRRSWMMLVLCRKGEANTNKSSNSVAVLQQHSNTLSTNPAKYCSNIAHILNKSTQQHCSNIATHYSNIVTVEYKVYYRLMQSLNKSLSLTR